MLDERGIARLAGPAERILVISEDAVDRTERPAQATEGCTDVADDLILVDAVIFRGRQSQPVVVPAELEVVLAL